MSENQGPSSFEVMNQMEAGNASHPRSSQGTPSSGSDGMMPFHGSIDIATPSLDGNLPTGTIESSMSFLTEGALNGTANQFGEKALGQMVVSQPDGKDLAGAAPAGLMHEATSAASASNSAAFIPTSFNARSGSPDQGQSM